MDIKIKEQSRLLQRLDSTAEKNLFLRLPCVLLMGIIIAALHMGKAFVRGGKSTRPIRLRLTALMSAAAFAGMILMPVGEIAALTDSETLFYEEMPWTAGYRQSDCSLFFLDRNDKVDGEYSIKIVNEEANDASVEKLFNIEPGCSYTFSAMVKFEGDTYSSGASIGIAESTQHSEFVQTDSWTYVSFDFDSGSSSEIVLCLRNGMYNEPCKGTAWFSDVKLEKNVTDVNRRYNILTVFFRNADVDIDGSGENFTQSMTDSDIGYLTNVMNNLYTSFSDISDGLLTVSNIDFVEAVVPVTELAYSEEYGYYLNENSSDVSATLDYFTSLDTYDQIICIAPIRDIARNWVGLGGTKYRGINFCQVNYSTGSDYPGNIGYFPDAVFVHEILHCLEAESREINPETPSLHDNELFGYYDIGDEWREWYTAYMRGTLEGNRGLDRRIFWGNEAPSVILISNDMTADATIFEEIPDNAPGITADAGDMEVTLTWEPVDNASFYTVYVRLPDGTIREDGRARDNTYTVFELENGTRYGFYVTVGDNVPTEESRAVYATPHEAYLYVFFAEGITVVRNGEVLANGEIVAKGDLLTVTADVPYGMTLTINGEPVLSGVTFPVGRNNVGIEFAQMPGFTDPDDTTVSSDTTVSTDVTDPSDTTVTTDDTEPSDTTVSTDDTDPSDTAVSTDITHPSDTTASGTGESSVSSDTEPSDTSSETSITSITSGTAPSVTVTSVTSATPPYIITGPITAPTGYIPPAIDIPPQRPVVTGTNSGSAETQAVKHKDAQTDDEETVSNGIFAIFGAVTEDSDVKLFCELSKLGKGRARMMTRLSFFDGPSDIRLVHTRAANEDALLAAELIDEDHLMLYPFDISIYKEGTGVKTQITDGGYISFEIPVPKPMREAVKSFKVYCIEGGVPELIPHELIEDEDGNLKAVFTAYKSSNYMFSVCGEDISSIAGITAEGVATDMGIPAANGRMPEAMLPFGRRRRRRHIYYIKHRTRS